MTFPLYERNLISRGIELALIFIIFVERIRVDLMKKNISVIGTLLLLSLFDSRRVFQSKYKDR